jgi:hypothetical protein
VLNERFMDFISMDLILCKDWVLDFGLEFINIYVKDPRSTKSDPVRQLTSISDSSFPCSLFFIPTAIAFWLSCPLLSRNTSVKLPSRECCRFGPKVSSCTSKLSLLNYAAQQPVIDKKPESPSVGMDPNNVR